MHYCAHTVPHKVIIVCFNNLNFTLSFPFKLVHYLFHLTFMKIEVIETIIL